VRETVTPAVLEQTVWAGSNLGSFPQASAALEALGDIVLSAQRVRRITEQVGQDRLSERRQQVAAFRDRPLMERLCSPPGAAPPELGVLMMDGGRYQRRDHFGQIEYNGSHWKEDKVGIVLRMRSAVHDHDPHPEFPEWLATAEVVREIASLGAAGPEFTADAESCRPTATADSAPGFAECVPELLSREVIASSECGAEFGWHLEQAAWSQGVVDAPRMAFVADGASVNWTIHRRHFSQMTGILDLMHALSYAYRAARAVDESGQTCRRWSAAIWQGRVADMIAELSSALADITLTEAQREPLQAALTYYDHHRRRMNYPEYRRQGLPLTSSHIESTIKQINIRIKGSEKFFRQDTGDTLLQLRADSLSASRPLAPFWPRWLARQTGANTYRKLVT
jgi:hypothetical protein